MTDDTIKITDEELERCTKVLESLAADSLLLTPFPEEKRVRLRIAAGRVSQPDKLEVRRRSRILKLARQQEKENRDRAVRAKTTIRASRLHSVFVPPPREPALIGSENGTHETGPGELLKPRACYICKEEYTKLHFFYDALCASCAALNYEKRFQTADLTGRVALITGARLKIGYQAALMMLRAGARVIATTRFPHDAALRFAREADVNVWGNRLQIHGLDLRHSASVEIFTRYLDRTCDRLDILINNAAQTVRRPPGFYAHMMETENLATQTLPEQAKKFLLSHDECKFQLTGTIDNRGIIGDPSNDSTWMTEWYEGRKHKAPGLTNSAELSQIPYRCEDSTSAETLFPVGKLDADLQQVDLREMNSWRMTLGDVPTAEMLEVNLVNAVAPFILCSKLKPLMTRDNTGQKHIVNVSAMEGKFARHTKTDKHPHTNMAKAALNMMTLTSARDYAKSGIFMNAVDTGWVTDEDPVGFATRKQRDHDFQPPLDIVDGAARVCDPFFSGINTGNHCWGNFLKDYFPTEW